MTTIPPVRRWVPDEDADGARRTVHVGLTGLGDEGLPMAVADAEAGFALHVWARRPAPLERPGATPATVRTTLTQLAAACDIVAFCVNEDEDVLPLLADGVLAGLRPGAGVVDHGTATPGGSRRITRLCARAGVPALDVPVSGGRPAAEARALTVLVGGPVDLFPTAMAEAGVDADAVVTRAHAGARGLPALVDRLPRTAAGRRPSVDLEWLHQDPAPTDRPPADR